MNSIRIEMDNEAIITAEEIRLILERYRIGKKPLAKLLGWGETTIIRYMEGDIPTNEYSNKLKTILNDPEFYYDLLNKRKECLTNVAYKKSKKAVLSKIMASKIYAAAYYIVNKSSAEICASYIQYLLYYIQAFSLAIKDKEMFQEECGISSNQMPYHKLYEAMKKNGIRTLEVNEEFLTEEEKELIDAVYDSFTWYGPKALRAISAFEKSMIKISRDKYNNKIISKDTLKTYFKEILTQYHITSLKEIGNYPDKRVQDIRELNI
ncbi:hypothetical protein I5677_05380 [Mobilitalea sibirica]|uniref:Uncharacterized protein n=1 Tax=Mobilitalea sibirica TaxID=1462919 RepID=A0A8J7HBT1_9FIRM|nr:hypothetical protein [Mobilitalea sibirica]MBH1940327.1 hypothetical protein [Mobilitalea sibirica]